MAPGIDTGLDQLPAHRQHRRRTASSQAFGHTSRNSLAQPVGPRRRVARKQLPPRLCHLPAVEPRNQLRRTSADHDRHRFGIGTAQRPQINPAARWPRTPWGHRHRARTWERVALSTHNQRAETAVPRFE